MGFFQKIRSKWKRWEVKLDRQNFLLLESAVFSMITAINSTLMFGLTDSLKWLQIVWFRINRTRMFPNKFMENLSVFCKVTKKNLQAYSKNTFLNILPMIDYKRHVFRDARVLILSGFLCHMLHLAVRQVLWSIFKT